MSESEIFDVIKNNILEILPNLNPDDIVMEKSMKDLGANSIDRADVVIKTMSDLSVKIPLVELGKVSNIGGLVGVFLQKLQEQS